MEGPSCSTSASNAADQITATLKQQEEIENELLSKEYDGIRLLRRDGSCFYRAFAFAYMEYLVVNKLTLEGVKFKAKCDECKNYLISIGYTAFTVEDIHERFVEMLDQFLGENANLEELEANFNQQECSDYYVTFIRLLVSAFMQKHASFYAGFIEEGETISHFCQTKVEPIVRECDHVQVAALALATGVPIRLEYCHELGNLSSVLMSTDCSHLTNSETSSGDCNGTTENGQPAVDQGQTEQSANSQPIPVTLLFRPGHYDILYPITSSHNA